MRCDAVRTIVPLATATLPERAYYARAWAGGWVIASDGPRVRWLDASLAQAAGA